MEEQDLLRTGRIIAAASEIESRMAACGAVGNGLREKTESLKEKLPPEAVKLSIYVGSIRNKLAHESNPQISQEEYQLFDEAALALLNALDQLTPVKEKDNREALLLPEEIHQPSPSADSPRFHLRGICWFPLLHLLFAGELLWQSFCRGWEYLFLLLLELSSLILLTYAVRTGTYGVFFGAGLTILVLTWLIAIWDKIRRQDHSAAGKLACYPLVNTAYYAMVLYEKSVPSYFAGALTVFGAAAGSLCFLYRKEWIAAAVCAGLSLTASIAGGILTQGGEHE